MPIIRGRGDVMGLYAQAAQDRWVVPTFCAENTMTLEAVLAACQAKATELGRRVPITLGLTGRYDHRPQALHYSSTRDLWTGLELFLDDVEVLARRDGPYPDVDVTIHFDHGQPIDDAEVWEGPLDRFSSVMFDASAFPWEENLERTAGFVARRGGEVLVEGAADEVADAGRTGHAELTTPDRAVEFRETTGVDFVVANLGTEHRAAVSDLHYHPDAARAISERIGTRLVLHGASSVPAEQLVSLFDDGVAKVNIWTILERHSSAVLLEAMVREATSVAGASVVDNLIASELLGPAARVEGGASIARFTTQWRNEVVHADMAASVKGYLDLFYRG